MNTQTDPISRAIGAQRARLAELTAAGIAGEAAGVPVRPSLQEEPFLRAEQLVTFLAEAIREDDADLLEQFLIQTQRGLTVAGQPADALLHQVARLEDALERLLADDEGPVAAAFLRRAVPAAPAGQTEPTLVGGTGRFSVESRQYLDDVLNRDRHSARRLVLSLIDDGVAMQDMYLHLLQPVQYEIGRLWQENQISVATEHYCSAVTQSVMAEVFGRMVFRRRPNPRVFVGTCLEGELHQIGVQMVADLLEHDGWTTHYLGASTPLDDLLAFVDETQPDVVGISMTLSDRQETVKAAVASMRSDSARNGPAIMVGGNPFLVSAGAWHEVGADAMAFDGGHAIRVANRLVEQGKVA